MRALRRIIVVAFACLLCAGSPALAQVAPSNTTNTASPAQNGVVGNVQLQNFSLGGTPTRTPPAPSQEAPPRRTTAAPLPSQAGTSPPAREAATPTARAPDSVTARRAAPSAAVAEKPSTASAAATTTLLVPTEQSPPPVESTVGDAPAPASANRYSLLPWIVAGLALACAAAWFFLRRRQRPSLAGVGEMLDIATPTPVAPQPKAAPPPESESRAPPRSVSSGVVSTRLRPWLEIEFKPDRGVVDEQKAAIAFELSVYNSGSMPARDVLLEASLFNAGPMQDQQIQLFFDNPVARGDKIPVIPPMQRVTVNTAVFLAKDQVVPIEMEGRALFVPMVAFNALYSWASGMGQTSASFLVGKETAGDKLAPFRLDLGPRIFRGLVARAHSLAVRK